MHMGELGQPGGALLLADEWLGYARSAVGASGLAWVNAIFLIRND